MNKVSAFTLAETLITIVILGIIATLTIPNIIQKQKERTLITQFKRAYAQISDAVDKAFIENRDTIFSENASFSKYIAPYLPVVQNCTRTWESHCTPVEDYQDLFIYSSENKGFTLCNRQGNFDSNGCFNSKLILKNNIIIYVSDRYNLNNNKTANALYVDVNGEKGPNRNGVDLHYLVIDKEKGLMPRLNNFCNYNVKSANEAHCSLWILNKNNMNYLHKDISNELNELLNNQ